MEKRGIYYPETVDLFLMLMRQLGVPEGAIIVGEHPVRSTYEEAGMIKQIVKKRGFKSIILVTTPIHTRRTWWTFREVLRGEGIRLYIIPSPYSEFRKYDWWKQRRYVRKVIIEYQKLIYYILAYYIW